MIVSLTIVALGFAWLGYETNWFAIRLPYGLPLQCAIEWGKLADGELEAETIVAELASSPDTFYEDLELANQHVESELCLREMPFHGRAKTLFTGYTTKKLDAMSKVYSRALGR